MNRHEEKLLGILSVDNFWLRDAEKLVNSMDIARREHFSTELGKVIYSAILQIIKTDNVPDFDLIDQLLQGNHVYLSGEGRYFLMTAIKNATSAANAEKAASMIRGEYFLRDANKRLDDAKMMLQGNIDPVEKIESALNLVSGISTTSDLTNVDHSFDAAADEMFQHLLRVSESGSTITGLDTGFARLNQMTHGLQNGNTIVVAGVPGGGKTTFCLNIMTHAARFNKKKVLFYSLEMPKHEIAMKVCSNLTNISMHDFQTAEVTSNDTKSEVLGQTIEDMGGIDFVIDDDASLTAETIENRTKKHAMKMNGVDLICVDYLTLLDAQGESETVRASNSAKTLKRLAKKFNCPVIIISQLVKNLNGRPGKSDLRQTGQLAQDASLILFLYKDENQITEGGKRKLIELIVDKNRMGETGDLIYEPYFETNKLVESDKEIQYPIDSNGNEIKTTRGLGRV